MIFEAVANADVNVLRIQLERIHSALYPTNREYNNESLVSITKY